MSTNYGRLSRCRTLLLHSVLLRIARWRYHTIKEGAGGRPTGTAAVKPVQGDTMNVSIHQTENLLFITLLQLIVMVGGPAPC
jgi:hypothetical protein